MSRGADKRQRYPRYDLTAGVIEPISLDFLRIAA
jgi:hypothetical protein